MAAAQGLSSCGSWALDCGISSRGAQAYSLHHQGSPYKTFLRPEAAKQPGVFADPFLGKKKKKRWIFFRNVIYIYGTNLNSSLTKTIEVKSDKYFYSH